MRGEKWAKIETRKRGTGWKNRGKIQGHRGTIQGHRGTIQGHRRERVKIRKSGFLKHITKPL
jgi:hypothetical protein